MNWGLTALLITLWVVAVIFFRMNRIWLPYYLIGAVGLAFIIIFAGGATAPIEFRLSLNHQTLDRSLKP